MNTTRIACLCCYQSAKDYLGDFLAHLNPHVDKFLLLDDRSSYQVFTYNPEVEMKPVTQFHRLGFETGGFEHESSNREILLREALRQGYDWVLCADVDFRFEKRFLEKMRSLALDGSVKPGGVAYALRLRDLWDTPQQYRCDGIWNEKRLPCFFKLEPFPTYWPAGTLHAPWYRPYQFAPNDVIMLDYNVYHLGMMTREVRVARAEKHERLDPTHKFQPQGYGYLAQEDGLVLERIPDGRNWYD